MKRWKGWLIFLGIFVFGMLLIGGGVVYLIMIGGAEDRDVPARVLALCGLVLVFGSIYGAAAWRFSLWWRTRDLPQHSDQKR